MNREDTPLIELSTAAEPSIPPTWCVVVCMQGCRETWTVDVDDFDPPLTVANAAHLLTPLLLAHEQIHDPVFGD